MKVAAKYFILALGAVAVAIGVIRIGGIHPPVCDPTGSLPWFRCANR